ncbi:RusA family crossover junction endodeoxyribonuclease [Streptomyces sp. NPDC003038]|uniref:RusA family crossover junction endodeoxyribonuclease n=1 Tax=unclassified Streptomyces TaxID=2593676 RepID=UPI0033AF12F0
MTDALTVVRVIAVQEGGQMDCCDTDSAHVWVRVMAWSPRRAFLTDAAPFVAASGIPADDLAGRTFLAELDLDAIPGNEDTAGERLEWPGLRLAPRGPEQDSAPMLLAASLLPAGGPELDVVRARLLAQALAPGTEKFTMVVLDGTPASKGRPRFGGNGRAYKADTDKVAETRTQWQLRRAFRRPLVGNLALGAIFFRPDRQRIDVDNMLKHVCDAGNTIAWVDDAQITAQYGVAELDAAAPRTVLVVARHVSSLDRTDVAPPSPRQKVR